MTKDHNPRRSDPEWTELISECRRSGLSDDCWCRNKGIPISSFYNAISRLRKKACPIPVREKQDVINLTASQDVVPVRIIPDIPEVSSHPSPPVPTDALSIRTTLCPVMEIQTGNAVIRISNEADPQLLSHVLQLMGGVR